MSPTSGATWTGWPTPPPSGSSRRRRPAGTTFECDTKVGPFKLTDVMEITEWSPGKVMGVRHTGLVTGTGRFTLKKATGGRTQFQWKEKLVFPWWMGGPVGAFVSKPVLAPDLAPEPGPAGHALLEVRPAGPVDKTPKPCG